MSGKRTYECPICGSELNPSLHARRGHGAAAYCPHCGVRFGAPSRAIVFSDQGTGRLAGSDTDCLALAYVRGIELCGAYLAGMDLFHADLASADLHGADLGGANLNSADLRAADLRNANLTEADLSDADLRGTDLDGAQLAGADLHGAVYNLDTRWPDDVDPGALGAVGKEK
jgi:DNA-directed RNA polymerase subunit RPC12/RpoP